MLHNVLQSKVFYFLLKNLILYYVPVIDFSNQMYTLCTSLQLFCFVIHMCNKTYKLDNYPVHRVVKVGIAPIVIGARKAQCQLLLPGPVESHYTKVDEVYLSITI